VASWLDRVVSSRETRALVLTTQFAEARQRVLAENIANIDTPDYHSRRLDPESFQHSLRKAFEQASSSARMKCT
jgi:flagellar basal-body rod protein FlgB